MRIVFSLFFISLFSIYAQQIDVKKAEAAEEFRWGVQSYHSAQYSEAILSFTRVLSIDPNNIQARKWLGNAYLAAGYTTAAIDEWKTVNTIKRSAVLSYLIDFFTTNKQQFANKIYISEQYYEAAVIQGLQKKEKIFFHPAMIRAKYDGTYYLVSMGTNEVLHVDAGGSIIRHIAGALSQLELPFDVIERKGMLFVSEFGGNRVSKIDKNGNTIATFGKLGRGYGEFVGPQYLCVDNKGYIYVSDYGNKRISKFDQEGSFILQFGQKSKDFPGLQNPRGIASEGSSIFVVDDASIEEFDYNGNHVASYAIVEKQAEALRSLGKGVFLMNTPNKVVIFNLKDNTILSSFQAEGATQLLGVDRDANGSIIVSDNENSTLRYFFPYSRVHSGFFVWIEKIRFSAFPRVVIEFTVRDWTGQPISGLNVNNFSLFEKNAQVPQLSLNLKRNGTKFVDTVLLFESSLDMLQNKRLLQDALNITKNSIRNYQDSKSLFRIISSTQQPIVLSSINSEVAFSLQKNMFSKQWNMSRGLQLAASQLLIGSKEKRTITYFTHGAMSNDMDVAHVERLAHYLKNNRIRFDAVVLNKYDSLSDALLYMVQFTGGKTYYLYQEEGITPLLEDIVRMNTGYYALEYESLVQSDFGRAYIPLSLQVHYFTRSGRIDSGYFAPLEF